MTPRARTTSLLATVALGLGIAGAPLVFLAFHRDERAPATVPAHPHAPVDAGTAAGGDNSQGAYLMGDSPGATLPADDSDLSRLPVSACDPHTIQAAPSTLPPEGAHT